MPKRNYRFIYGRLYEWLWSLQTEILKVVVIYDFQFEVELFLNQTIVIEVKTRKCYLYGNSKASMLIVHERLTSAFRLLPQK